MVKIIESQRPRIGMAGRRKRPSRQTEEFIYYTATDGRTILENDKQAATSQDISKAESPSTAVTLCSSTITPSTTRKRQKRNVRRTSTRIGTQSHDDYLDLLDEPHRHTVKTDTSVQVSVDGDDQKSIELVNGNSSSLLVVENDVDDHQTQIEQLRKQIQEKDGMIAELLQSKADSYSPATMMRTKNINSKTVQSMQLQLEEMKQSHDQETKQMKIDVTKWKNKAASLSLELERITKYNSSQNRNVYNGRFLLEETFIPETHEVRKQNERQLSLTTSDSTAVGVCEKPPTKTILSSSQRQKRNAHCNNNLDATVAECNRIDTTDDRVPRQPIVSPRTLHNFTYLGKPLSFQHHLDGKAKFQLLVMPPVDDSEDDDIL